MIAVLLDFCNAKSIFLRCYNFNHNSLMIFMTGYNNYENHFVMKNVTSSLKQKQKTGYTKDIKK